MGWGEEARGHRVTEQEESETDPPRARGSVALEEATQGHVGKKHGRLSLGKPGDQGLCPLWETELEFH